MNNAVFGKYHGKCEKTQQKEERTIYYLNQIIILQSFSENIY